MKTFALYPHSGHGYSCVINNILDDDERDHYRPENFRKCIMSFRDGCCRDIQNLVPKEDELVWTRTIRLLSEGCDSEAAQTWNQFYYDADRLVKKMYDRFDAISERSLFFVYAKAPLILLVFSIFLLVIGKYAWATALTNLPYQFLMESPRRLQRRRVRSNFYQAMEELCCAVSKKLQPMATVHLQQRLHVGDNSRHDSDENGNTRHPKHLSNCHYLQVSDLSC